MVLGRRRGLVLRRCRGMVLRRRRGRNRRHQREPAEQQKKAEREKESHGGVALLRWTIPGRAARHPPQPALAAAGGWASRAKLGRAPGRERGGQVGEIRG